MGRLIAPILLFVVSGGASNILAAGLVLLGTNQPAALTAFPTLHTLKAFNGRIYMGYGDWNQYPAVVVTSYQPSDGTFHLEFSAYTDSIGIFREVGGKLYLPSIDPVHFQDFHDLTYLSDGVWRDQSPVGMLHVYDVATVTGSDLWFTGAKTVNDTGSDNAVVFRSLDGGRTWQDHTVPTSQVRYYWGFPLRGKFYVRDTVYTNGIGTRVTSAPYEQLFKPTPVGQGNSQFIVGLAQRTPGILLEFLQTVVTYDATTWRALRPNVWDFSCDGTNVFSLERNNVTSVNQLWKGSSLAPAQATWQSLGFTNVPPEARCVEVMDGVIYVGDTKGRLWAGRLDGSPLVASASTMVNELNDDFGKGLSIDGNRIAVGAPDYSGSNFLCGQVTVWETFSGGDGGTQWTRTGVIDSPEPSFSGWFGKDVALKDDVLVVAETGRDTAGNDRGRSSQLHLYQRVDQEWVRRLTTNHLYIHSVATDGESLVVGTPTQLYHYQLSRDSNNVLSATADGGTLFSPVPTFIYEPSVKVVMESNTIVAALSGDVSRYGGPGEVRVYERLSSGVVVLNNVLQQTWVTPPRGAPLKPDRFGFSIALKNDWLAVGAPRDDTTAMQSGAVYLYQRINSSPNTWTFVLRQTISSPSRQAEGAFGASVALADSRLIVGSPGAEVNGTRHQGRTFMYQYSGSDWVQTAEIGRPIRSTGEFGSRVVADAEWIAIASRFSDTSTNLLDRVTVIPHLDPFPAWLAFHGLQGVDGLPSSDIDGDNVNNLAEFACNLDPKRPDALMLEPISGISGLPVVRRLESGGQPVMMVRKLQRRYPSLSKLIYTGELSTDLRNWLPNTAEPISIQFIDSQWEKVTFRFVISPDTPQLFYRSKVQLEASE